MENKQNSNKNKSKGNKKPFIKPKKDFSFLLESKYVKKWIGNYEKEYEKQNRLSILSDFCDFIEKDPDTLILEHNKDIKTDDPSEITDIAKNQLKMYYNYLIGEKNNINDNTIEKPITINSARQYVFSKLASFFKRNNVPIKFQKGEIPSEDIKGTVEKVWKDGEKRIMAENKKDWLKQIRDSFINIRDKAIFLCKLSSGMDDCDLFELKTKDFNRGYYDIYNICYINGNRLKTETYFQTFFNSECCDLINLYLKDRERKGEKLTENSWLFVGNKKINEKYTQMKPNIFYANLQEVCQKLNLKNITPKQFRHWFNSELKRNGIDFEIVERMMGHKTQISQKYFDLFKDEEGFVKYYMENIEIYTVLGNGNKKIKEIDKKVEELEAFNKKLVEHLAETNKKLEFVTSEYFKLNERIEQIIKSFKFADEFEKSLKDNNDKAAYEQFKKITSK